MTNANAAAPDKCADRGWQVLPEHARFVRADLTGTLGQAAAVSLLAHLILVSVLGAPMAGRQPGGMADSLRAPLQATLRGARAVAPAATQPAVERTVDAVNAGAPRAPPHLNSTAAGTATAPASSVAYPLPLEGLPAPRYYLPREVDQPAAPLEHANLVYPDAALRQRIGGVVVMHLFIGADGRLERTEVVRAEPPGVFEDAVRDAAVASRFRAAVLGQRAVSSRVTIEVPFDPNCSDFETCSQREGTARLRR